LRSIKSKRSYIEGPISKTPLSSENLQDFQDPEESPEESDDAIFEDNDETCSSSFTTYNELLRHINRGKHKKNLQLYKVKKYQKILISVF